MCDETDWKPYNSVDELPQYDDDGWVGTIMLANGHVYSKHKQCGRYVQYNHVCEWCHNFKRFPLMVMVWYATANTPREFDPQTFKDKLEKRLDNMISTLLESNRHDG